MLSDFKRKNLLPVLFKQEAKKKTQNVCKKDFIPLRIVCDNGIVENVEKVMGISKKKSLLS